jgi:hypothetical protein
MALRCDWYAGSQDHAPEDEWFEYRLEHDPLFLKRIEEARANFQAQRGTR